jgi:hypothetical protein
MNNRKLWSRVLVIVGLTAMVVGAIDPLEGSLIILPGSVVLTAGALLAGTRYRKLILWSFALMVVGFAALWWLSALGGLGDIGDGGKRSYWWALVLAPFPVGWVMGVVGAILMLREWRKAPAKPAAPPVAP